MNRAARIQRLYTLKTRIDAEIAEVEAEIEAEIEAARHAREAANATANSIRRTKVAICGTDGGYYRHRRTLQQPACDACKLAHRVYEANRRARNEVAS